MKYLKYFENIIVNEKYENFIFKFFIPSYSKDYVNLTFVKDIDEKILYMLKCMIPIKKSTTTGAFFKEIPCLILHKSIINYEPILDKSIILNAEDIYSMIGGDLLYKLYNDLIWRNKETKKEQMLIDNLLESDSFKMYLEAKKYNL